MRVSVCLPTYNGAAFVAEAVRSVLAQCWQDFELLVIDDQSTDTTLDIVRSFADPRLQVCQNPQRLGIPRNWNHCLGLARGEYVCLFHQDDVMLPENLERKVEILAADPTVSLVHSAAELITDDSAPAVPSDWMEDASENFIMPGNRYLRRLLFRGNLVCASTVVAHRQKLLDLGGFDEGLGFACDYEMWMKLCVGGSVAFLSQPLVRYRWHGMNASHAYRFERGVEECLLAGRRALQYYVEQTGHQDEADVLTDALTSLAKPRRWAAELERGKAWLEEQWKNWRRVAGELEQLVGERERTLQEQQAWVSELERGKAWLEGQWKSWQKTAGELERMVGERERMLREQQAWVAELERGKAWLEGQVRNWQAKVEHQQSTIAQQQSTIEQLQSTTARQQSTVEQLQSTVEQLRRQWVPQPLRQMVKTSLRAMRSADD